VTTQENLSTNVTSAIASLPVDDNAPTERLFLAPQPANLTSSQSLDNSQAITNASTDLGDKERTKKRYEEAANRLKDSLNLCQGNWQPFEIPKFDDIPNNVLPQVQEAIEGMINARENSMKNPDFWSKKKYIVKRVFSAVCPFAKNFLQVAKEGSSVALLCYFCCSFSLDNRFESLWFISWRIVAFNNGLLSRHPTSHC
jgi:hypothetical protein